MAAPFLLVGLVLMIACANVAGVLLARGLGRRREVGIRLALGASRRNVIQMLMAESFLLSVVGSAVGLTLALWLTSLVGRLRLPGMAEPLDVTALVDQRFAVYLVGLIIVTTFVTGFLPAWQSVRQDLVTGLKSEVGGGPTRRLSLRHGLVVGQVAVSAVLVIFSLVLVRSFWRVANASPGFDVDAGVVANLDLDPARYPPAEARSLAEQLIARAEQLPGVTAASVSNIVPLSGDSNIAYPQSDASPDVNGPETNVTNVGPNYFKVMGIPLVRGREFTDADRVGSMPVVVINETLAARFFIGRDPLGHRVRLNRTAPYHEIVGVVRDSKYQFLSESPRPLVYLPYLETGGRLILQVRAAGDLGGVIPEVRALIAGVDRTLVPDVRALRDVASQEIIMRRLGAALLALLGGVGLVLAVVGLYGLMTHHVTERTRELSIRLALGAPRGVILLKVVGDGLRLTALGTLIAFGVAIVATRPLTFLLAGVSAADPGVIAGISALFAAVSTLACLGPGTRAMKVDLLTSLRRE